MFRFFCTAVFKINDLSDLFVCSAFDCMMKIGDYKYWGLVSLISYNKSSLRFITYYEPLMYTERFRNKTETKSKGT